MSRATHVAALAALTLAGTALAQSTTTFSYQGRLTDAGANVTGTADFMVQAWDAATGGRALTTHGDVIQNVPVVDGMFHLTVDLGTRPFNTRNDDPVWFEIQVTYPRGGTPVTLGPRQQVLATPRALGVRGLDIDEINPGIFQYGLVGSLQVSGPGDSRLNGHMATFRNDLSDPTQTNGISIQIDRQHTNRGDNFITFYNGQDNVVGRIEGYDKENSDWVPPPGAFDWANARLSLDFDPGRFPSLGLSGGRAPSAGFTGGALPSATFNGGSLPTASLSTGSLPSLSLNTTRVVGVNVVTGVSFNAGSLPSLSFNAGSLPSLGFDPGWFPTLNFDPGVLPSLIVQQAGQAPSASFRIDNLPSQQDWNDLLQWSTVHDVDSMISLDPVALATFPLRIAAKSIALDEGVVYGSKGADYAEWLPKLDPTERFQMGQVVGVFGGKISLKTEGADQVMAISSTPIVLGNAPLDGNTENYGKAAFVGQVPVVVRGRVDVGDYILPSGLDDGTAIAIPPSRLEVRHLEHLVGRAWNASDNDVYSFINVVVGQRGGEVSHVLRNQEKRFERRLAAGKKQQLALESRLEAVEAALATVTAALENQR